MANAVTLRTYINTGGGAAWREMAADDKLYFQAAGAFSYGSGGAIAVSAYNGGTHTISAANADVCTTTHQRNVEYSSDATHCKIAGGGEVLLNTLAITDCINLHTTCSPNAEITASSFFVYGAAEANPPSGVTVYGVKQGDATWTDVGGSGAAYSLGTDASGATHDQYLALTVTPTSNGAKTGTLKCSVTLV